MKEVFYRDENGRIKRGFWLESAGDMATVLVFVNGKEQQRVQVPEKDLKTFSFFYPQKP